MVFGTSPSSILTTFISTELAEPRSVGVSADGPAGASAVFAFADLPVLAAFFAVFAFFFTALLLAAVSSSASEAAGFSAFALAV